MPAKKEPTKATLRKKLGTMGKSHRALGKKGLATLQELAAAFPKDFAEEVGKHGVLEVAAAGAELEALELLLGHGADPNALPAEPSLQPRALGRPFEPLRELKDAEVVAVCERLLAAGASPNDLYPHPSHVQYVTPGWGQRRTALDLALGKRSDAVALLCRAELDSSTRCSAISIAVHMSSIVGGGGYQPLSPADRRVALGLLETVLDELGGPTTPDRWGTTAAHVAAITGNLEALDLLVEHGAPVDAELSADVSYGGGGDRHFSPIGGGVHESVQLPAGARPLDVIDRMLGVLEAKLVRVKSASGMVQSFDDLPARLEAMRAVRARLEARGATRSGAQVQRPAFAEAIDAILGPVVGQTYAQQIADINLVGMGPWGYLMNVGTKCREQLARLEPLAEQDPVAYVVRGWHTRQTVALHDDENYGYDSIWGELDVPIHPEDYPAEAEALFHEHILGVQGSDILVLEKKSGGTRLHRINHSEVKDEGTLDDGLLATFAARVEALS
ncbi:ankyrin repeat domain-containing protein [Paraliomyxa miuraensis]|uniref:ankyrin repeat domain-containing protein n=1 Tax=Paraliomyxa miuraensis TaxID=376150 RepID=UPI00225C1950|nr:ankyrin repeat domain-containing protein [Paraliomyxa miuraensis]MCX4246164.1 ankyrin repeat domain-containing protein [Paraliomyxa miuraensis]